MKIYIVKSALVDGCVCGVFSTMAQALEKAETSERWSFGELQPAIDCVEAWEVDGEKIDAPEAKAPRTVP